MSSGSRVAEARRIAASRDSCVNTARARDRTSTIYAAPPTVLTHRREPAMARTTSKTRSTSTQLGALDTITASLVARQSRTDDGTMSVPDQIDAMRDWCAKQNPPIAIGSIYTELSTSGRKPLDKRK